MKAGEDSQNGTILEQGGGQDGGKEKADQGATLSSTEGTSALQAEGKIGLEENIFQGESQGLGIDSALEITQTGIRLDTPNLMQMKMSPTVAPYMGYYNGYQPPYYRPFTYSNISTVPYNYYGSRIGQPPPLQTVGEEALQATVYLSPQGTQVPLPSGKTMKGMSLDPSHSFQPMTAQKISPQAIKNTASKPDGLQINHYEPMGSFRISKPKSKSAKNKGQTKGKIGGNSDRPFGCEFPGCGWAFARQSDLRRHTKSHSEPTFHCPYWRNDPTCHKNGGAFNRLDVLKRHLRLVHYVLDKQSQISSSREDPGWCRSCQRIFVNSKVFIDHCLECAQSMSRNSASGQAFSRKEDTSSKFTPSINEKDSKMNHLSLKSDAGPLNDSSIYLSDIGKISANDSTPLLQSPPPNTADSNMHNPPHVLPGNSSQENDNTNLFNKYSHTKSFSVSSKPLNAVASNGTGGF